MAPLPRGTLQNLALAKIADARLLLQNSRYSNAYYLYGYGVELGLKACIARQILPETIPDKALVSGSRSLFTHRLMDLVVLAGLATDLRKRRDDPEFDSRWLVVVEWSEESRYELIDVAVATAMGDAVEHEVDGVITWLKQHW